MMGKSACVLASLQTIPNRLLDSSHIPNTAFDNVSNTCHNTASDSFSFLGRDITFVLISAENIRFCFADVFKDHVKTKSVTLSLSFLPCSNLIRKLIDLI